VAQYFRLGKILAGLKMFFPNREKSCLGVFTPVGLHTATTIFQSMA
jgi:hypothetical protein